MTPPPAATERRRRRGAPNLPRAAALAAAITTVAAGCYASRGRNADAGTADAGSAAPYDVPRQVAFAHIPCGSRSAAWDLPLIVTIAAPPQPWCTSGPFSWSAPDVEELRLRFVVSDPETAFRTVSSGETVLPRASFCWGGYTTRGGCEPLTGTVRFTSGAPGGRILGDYDLTFLRDGHRAAGAFDATWCGPLVCGW